MQRWTPINSIKLSHSLWFLFFVCVQEITDTDNSSESASAAHTVKHLMIAVSTITNPILYVVFNRTFRLGLRRLAPCCKQGLVEDVGCGVTGRNLNGDREKTVSTIAGLWWPRSCLLGARWSTYERFVLSANHWIIEEMSQKYRNWFKDKPRAKKTQMAKIGGSSRFSGL